MVEPFDLVVAQYRPMVFTYLRTLTGRPDLAEDLAQETFILAYRRLESFRDGSDFGAWLRGIARNKVLEDRRAAARRHVIADSRIIEGMEEVYRSLDDPHPRADTWEKRRDTLRDCISRLASKLREAVDRVYREGLDLEQAAARLGTTYESVAKRLSRARSLLRECMNRSLNREGFHGSGA
jgi:RNA polymerase sigma-70 factor (ECF subfamily)